jgi:hypothetical protein
VATLGRSLPSDDFAVLQAFLEKNPSSDAVKGDALNALKNDVAAKLLANNDWPDGFAQRFLAMVDNPDVGLVWQNYTIQFLDALWKRENDPVIRQAIYDRLVLATEDTRVTISGTALLTLSRLQKHSGTSKRVLGDMAVRVVMNVAIPWQDKITALHVAADVGDVRALAQARVWAADAKAPVMLRMASFAVMGKLGNIATDRPLLAGYAKGGEFRLRTAAKAAIKKLEKK